MKENEQPWEYTPPSVADGYDDYDESREKIIARGETVDDAEEEVEPSDPQYHHRETTDNYVHAADYRRGKTVEELMREDEQKMQLQKAEEQRRAEKQAYHELKDVNVSVDMISDMGYNYKQQERRDKERQKDLEDLAKEIGRGPKLEDMSDINYTSAPLKKASTFDSQEALGREEKELIKSRLQKEMDSRPKGVNKKHSAELYKNLMHEQKVKRAKQGLVSLVLMAVGGIAESILIYVKLNPDDLKLIEYAAVCGVIFSLLMLLKSKLFRTVSCLFFAAQTVFMVYNCVTFALNTEQKPDNYFTSLIFFIVVIAVAAIITIQLATNTNIESYYTTSFAKPKTDKHRVNVTNKKR